MAFTKALRTSAESIYVAWGKFNDLIDDLLSVSSGKGASQIGLEDSGNKVAAITVEAAIAEIATAVVGNYTAGEDLSAYEVCYISATNTFSLADASDVDMSLVGAMALEDIDDGLTGRFLLIGEVSNTNWTFTPGETLYLSETAGGITGTAPVVSGDALMKVGFAITATKIMFHPATDFESLV